MDFEALAPLLSRFQQEHLLRFHDQLSPDERGELEAQLQQVDFDLLAQLVREDASGEPPAKKARRAVPPAALVRVAREAAENAQWQRATLAGEAMLRAGRLGVILVAGGEATRLGAPYPKGMFPIGPVSRKTLFQVLAEQLLARSRRAGAPIPYYVMTSDATHEATTTFFREHDYFGLPPDDVFFFRQGNMPAVDRQSGRVLLAEPHRLAWNPDGHGGIVSALMRSGALDDMRARGVERLYYHQVDNPLARVCDPAFLGFHAERGAEVSTKVVAKLGPAEKMGVLVDIDGTTQIIEYSDLPDDVAALRDESGELRFWAGSTAIHIFDRALFDRLARKGGELPFHRAIKKVPYLDDTGRRVEPEQENALKFERFIFDVLPLANKSLVVEVRREDEFCPLKNKSGDFSPPFVQAAMSRQYAGWLRAAGVDVPDGLPVEISPLYALDADELAGKIDRPMRCDAPLYLS
ncbi:MAG: UTP--glucose-1-phosphate uridylyltransferase [Planctomycetaceae bacterium]